jgi:hypothetical protein
MLTIDSFTKKRVISLDGSEDRLEAFNDAVLNEYGWTIKRWPGVRFSHGVEMPGWFTMPPNFMGAMAAHMSLWQWALDHNYKSLLVFEDDAKPRPGSDQDLKDFLAAVPDDWDMIYFGGMVVGGMKVPEGQRYRVNDKVGRCTGITATHAYAITNSAMRALMPHATGWPMNTFDLKIARAQPLLNLNVYRPFEWFFGQSAGVSTITGLDCPEEFWEAGDWLPD